MIVFAGFGTAIPADAKVAANLAKRRHAMAWRAHPATLPDSKPRPICGVTTTMFASLAAGLLIRWTRTSSSGLVRIGAGSFTVYASLTDLPRRQPLVEQAGVRSTLHAFAQEQ